MNKKLYTAIIFAMFTSAYAKPPSIPLQCGKLNGALTAERQFLSAASGGGDIYNVMVTFAGKKPSNAKAEAALRECIAEAVKKDGSKDVLATAWFRGKLSASESDDEMLHPFGPIKFISYTASTKKVVIREQTTTGGIR